MPVVSFPVESGVNERQVIDAVLSLTQERVDDVRDEMGAAMNGAGALVLRFARVSGMTQDQADATFATLDAHLTRLHVLRQTLQARVDAHLSQQRLAAVIAAESSTPTHKAA